MPGKQVLSIGQCGADHAALSWALGQDFDAEVVRADSLDDALDKLRSRRFALVLVNRVLDADGSSGLDLIRHLKAEKDLAAVPVMLVSNYPEAQEEAVEAGAIPGFGKGRLGQPEMVAAVSDYLDPIK
jgi:two-component system chemotaxis response regulator CheY